MLFYERIKRHGKWVFILLAVTFGATFVLGGVGAGGIGIFDLIGKGGGSGGNGSTAKTTKSEVDTRITAAEAAVKAKPKDAGAWADLAEAAIAKPDAARAKTAADEARTLKPDDTALATRMATVYASIAADAQSRQTTVEQQIVGSFQAPTNSFGADVVPGGFEDVFQTNETAVENSLSSRIQSALGPLQAEQQAASTAAIACYRTLVKASPDDPSAWFQLGEAAYTAGDSATAASAFKKFLALAPNDPNAGQIKQVLSQIEPTTAATTALTLPASTAGTTAGASTAAAASSSAATTG